VIKSSGTESFSHTISAVVKVRGSWGSETPASNTPAEYVSASKNQLTICSLTDPWVFITVVTAINSSITHRSFMDAAPTEIAVIRTWNKSVRARATYIPHNNTGTLKIVYNLWRLRLKPRDGNGSVGRGSWVKWVTIFDESRGSSVRVTH